MMKFRQESLAAALILISVVARAGMVAPEEMAQRDLWTAQAFKAAPFSFVYDGHASSNLLGAWVRTVPGQFPSANGTEQTTIWTDPSSGLRVRCVAVSYSDFPTVEWTVVYFKNIGTNDTGILSDFRAIDASFSRQPQGEFVLRHWLGSQATKADYQPQQTPLGPSANLTLAPSGGWATCGNWPYFNIDWGSGGALLAVGWPGRWTAAFVRDGGDKLSVRAGQELTHFKLHPGEEIRFCH